MEWITIECESHLELFYQFVQLDKWLLGEFICVSRLTVDLTLKVNGAEKVWAILIARWFRA